MLREPQHERLLIHLIHQNESLLTNPSADFVIEGGDILVMVGNHAELDQALARLGAEPAAEAPLA